MTTKIQLRRDTAINWSTSNPVLAQGEPGYDLTSKKLKFGNGSSAWNALEWFDDQQTLTDSLTNGNLLVTLSSSGTLTTPLLLPAQFTAVLDTAHMSFPVPSVALTDTPWQFAVQFQVAPNGDVTTIMDSPFPNPINPGYVSGYAFAFTEADHGIPGYTFELTLNDVVLPGGAGWTANPAVSQAPVYPSTVASSGAVKLTADTNSLVFGTDGSLKLPGGTIQPESAINLQIIGDNYLILNTAANGQIEIGRYQAGGAVVLGGVNTTTVVDGTLEVVGNLTYASGDITQSSQDNTSCLPGVDTVIYTSTAQFKHAIKMFVMIEGTPDGGTAWETQACDVIAVRGFVDNIVHVNAYGVTYSSAAAFATFDGQWNALTNRIEITCRPTSATNAVVASVHAIEMTTND